MARTDFDHEPDLEAEELRALAEQQGFVRYYEESRKLQERERDEKERERDAWNKYVAAVEAKLGAQRTLLGYAILALNGITMLAVGIVYLVRWLL